MSLDYSGLQSIYRSEKNSASLSSIPSDFYAQLTALIAKLEKEHTEPALKLAEDILNMRLTKILRLVSRSGDIQLPENITDLEKRTYGRIADTIKEHKSEILKIEPKKEETTCSVCEPEVAEETSASDEDGKTLLRILEPIPAIVGSDMCHYGPFKENDEPRIPSDTAEVLVRRGIAVELV